MAQIWMDNENSAVHMAPSSAAKMGLLGIQSAKKSVLGNLDNLMNYKQAGTPFRSGPLKPNISSVTKSSLHKDTLRKLQRKQNFKEAQQQLQKQLRPTQLAAPPAEKVEQTAKANATINLFDYMDFPSDNCLKRCKHRVTEIWNDTQCLSDEAIGQLINGAVEDEEDNYMMPMTLDEDEAITSHPIQDYENNLLKRSVKYSDFLDLIAPIPNFNNIDLDIF